MSDMYTLQIGSSSALPDQKLVSDGKSKKPPLRNCCGVTTPSSLKEKTFNAGHNSWSVSASTYAV